MKYRIYLGVGNYIDISIVTTDRYVELNMKKPKSIKRVQLILRSVAELLKNKYR